LEFTIENPSNLVDIHIFSVTSSDKQFHIVMFQPQILGPSRSVDVKILFLPHRIETSRSQLLISTSIGEFYYPVEGRAVVNPYRLYPLVGYR